MTRWPMSSFLDDRMTEFGVASLMDHIGDATQVTYQSPEIDNVLLVACVGPETGNYGDDPEGTEWERRRAITITKDAGSDYGGVAAVDTINGSFVIDGETWSIDSIEFETTNLITLRLAYSHASEIARPDLRPQR